MHGLFVCILPDLQGLFTESHGIIDNTMYDLEYSEQFVRGGTAFEGKWWGGEPVSARRHGVRGQVVGRRTGEYHCRMAPQWVCYVSCKGFNIAARTLHVHVYAKTYMYMCVNASYFTYTYMYPKLHCCSSNEI